jgi:hypothetical protein
VRSLFRCSPTPDLQLRHLLARGRNPKEKPIERLFKDISDWERNSFKALH